MYGAGGVGAARVHGFFMAFGTDLKDYRAFMGPREGRGTFHVMAMQWFHAICTQKPCYR